MEDKILWPDFLKLKMMGLAAYAEFYSEDQVALKSLVEDH